MSIDEGRGPVAFELTAETEIDAPAETVWRSLTEDIGSRWGCVAPAST
jgi:uncharacterized protein YndB with AHSA1/START domain